MKAIIAALGGAKDKGADSSEEKAPESGAAEKKTDYRAVIKDAAEAGDWDAFADAVAGYVKQCSMK